MLYFLLTLFASLCKYTRHIKIIKKNNIPVYGVESNSANVQIGCLERFLFVNKLICKEVCSDQLI